MYGCNVDNQKKDFDKDIRFFTFPKDKKKQLEWIHLCRRKDKFNVTSARICSKHFNKDDYVRNLKHELLAYSPRNGRVRALKEEAIPSNHLPLPRKYKDNSDREFRQDQRRKKQLVESVLKGYVIIKKSFLISKC